MRMGYDLIMFQGMFTRVRNEMCFKSFMMN
jgi:hypothetical protein